jgi:hypothetical protein
MLATMYNSYDRFIGNNKVFMENDRIVEINGIKLFIHQDYRINRRNVICNSKKLQDILDTIGFKDIISPTIRNTLLSDILYQNKLDDIKLVSVDGFY